jgi:glycerol-3-phosphate dehydrogenase (NAD(P)+)
MARIAILGSGGFGTSLAVMSYHYGHQVVLWSKFEEEINAIRNYGENRKLLPGIAIENGIGLTTDLERIKGADLLIFAVPSFAVRETARSVKPFVSENTVVVNVGKGLEAGSLKRLSAVIGEELNSEKVVALSGPSHAEEIARGMPTTIVAASEDRKSAEYVQDILMNKTLRIYVSDDVIGVEIGGALKNIIAVCAGICDGMGLGDNTKAALMTRGIAEIARLGVCMGGHEATFAGLAGIGDLIVTCTSMHSRNRRAGILIGQGLSAQQAVERVGTVEGYHAAKTAWELAKSVDVTMPIVEQLHGVLYEHKDIRVSVENLMDRPKRHENEQVWQKTL